eukprot:gnl/TRDRNA2_/TRDRNA2_192631_c0_seq1.p1 gnl/TRDRNA2_/TRDRNA2_192631_c0~~gnl/TRDRNA2_/TRDRNA2_192631_c0_seq1.p1  ORF type:complete len:319 (+),score=103.21 gnl/TRDRNA2_/TRDRNA2_192631_c0_seq1:25-957(+)
MAPKPAAKKSPSPAAAKAAPAKAPAKEEEPKTAAGSGAAAAKAIAKSAAAAPPEAKAAAAPPKAAPAPAKGAPAPAKGGAKAAPAKAPPAKAGAKAAVVEPAGPSEEELAEKKRLEEEAEAAKKAEEERLAEEKRKAEEAAEAERKRKEEKENGEVVLKYSMYNEKFAIKGGKCKAADVDETYCLSDVMPNCVIHLSTKDQTEMYKIMSSGETCPYIFEEPVGTFHGLEAGETYYVYIDEDQEEFLKSQAKAKQNFAGVKSAGTRGEGCSCIEGNPCAQECDMLGNQICLDFPNRFAVAKAHGWLGYQAK